VGEKAVCCHVGAHVRVYFEILAGDFMQVELKYLSVVIHEKVVQQLIANKRDKAELMMAATEKTPGQVRGIAYRLTVDREIATAHFMLST
jgi:hypothetical protein